MANEVNHYKVVSLPASLQPSSLYYAKGVADDFFKLYLTTDSATPTAISIDAVINARQIIAGTGLTGGGNLSADRTLSVNFGTTAGTVAQGNHTHTFASITSKPTTLLGYGITDAVSNNGTGATGTWGISITGNAATATKLTTPRTIGISGAVTGAGVAFDGSANITIATTAVDATKLTGVIAIGNIPTGTTASTVAIGNDVRIVNGSTAFSWGNHSTQGYMKKLTDGSDVDITPADQSVDGVVSWNAASGKFILGNAITGYIPVSEKGAANGVATLGADGKLLSSELPSLIIVDTFVVASQAAMLALTQAEQGDIAVRTDENKSYILKAAPASTLANWEWLRTPSVSNTDGVPEGTTNLYFTTARARASLVAGAGITYTAASGTIAVNRGTTDTWYAALSHTHTIAQVTGLQSALDGKEAAFTKNTAFNKNFGTAAGTVAQGNDSRFHTHANKTVLDGITAPLVTNWNTAFGWGDHATAGYAKLAGVETFTGKKTFSVGLASSVDAVAANDVPRLSQVTTLVANANSWSEESW